MNLITNFDSVEIRMREALLQSSIYLGLHTVMFHYVTGKVILLMTILPFYFSLNFNFCLSPKFLSSFALFTSVTTSYDPTPRSSPHLRMATPVTLTHYQALILGDDCLLKSAVVWDMTPCN